jgi:hypothetical protein
MASTPEELALELSRASLCAQERSEDQLRERAATVLSAASIVVPVAAIALGGSPGIAAIPFALAGGAYVLCVRACGVALFPRGVYSGLLGSEMLGTVKQKQADLRQMQAMVARYLDSGHAYNEARLDKAINGVRNGILLLTIEMVALVAALAVRLLS